MFSDVLLLILTASQQTFDLCTTFQRTTEESSLTLVTPGYLEGVQYPNNSYCECTIRSDPFSGRPQSLNMTVEDLSLEDCSTTDTPWDTLTITAVYLFEHL